MPEETNSENPIQSTATAIATLAREVPIYDDAIQPSARSLGRGLGGILTWIMQPFIMLGIKAQHNIDRFEEEYAERIRDTPPRNLKRQTQPSVVLHYRLSVTPFTKMSFAGCLSISSRAPAMLTLETTLILLSSKLSDSSPRTKPNCFDI